MRTTLNLDDDVLIYARSHARRERISIGDAVSRLVRAGIQAQNLPGAKPVLLTSVFSLLPARGETITSEHVRELMDRAD